jgi:hypothetical protein
MRYRLPRSHPLRGAGKPARANYVDTWMDLAHVPDLTVYEYQEPFIRGNILDPNGEPCRYYDGPDQLGFLHEFFPKREDDE